MHHLLYHANCADGFAAACIARHALLQRGIAPADINPQPVNYGWPEQLPLGKDQVLYPGDTLTYLDYTPPQNTIDRFLEEYPENIIPLTIIDHHQSAAPRHGCSKQPPSPAGFAVGPLEQFSEAAPTGWISVFSFDHSGAGLAWQHYFPHDPAPPAVQWIEWRDLGHAFDPAHSTHLRTLQAMNLHAYLFRALPRTFEAWTSLLMVPLPTDNAIENAVITGSRLRDSDRQIIRTAATQPHWLDFSRFELSALCPTPYALHRIPAVNGLGAELVSDACKAMLDAYPDAPFAASWYVDHRTGLLTYSLRSRRGSDVNVAQIAAAMAPGGGGHPNAAGFSTPNPVPFSA